MRVKKIYERHYDNDTDANGAKKPNKFLGEFEILQLVKRDIYTSTMTGRLVGTDEIYLIDEYEVCGYNGGSRFEVGLLALTDQVNRKHNDDQ